MPDPNAKPAWQRHHTKLLDVQGSSLLEDEAESRLQVDVSKDDSPATADELKQAYDLFKNGVTNGTLVNDQLNFEGPAGDTYLYFTLEVEAWGGLGGQRKEYIVNWYYETFVLGDSP